MALNIIKVKDVSMRFNLSRQKEVRLKEYFINALKRKLTFDEFWALQNISFELQKGDTLGLIGVNGSGKSTLLKLISGIIPPTKGTIEVNGSISPLIEIGGGFDNNLSAKENIFLVGAMHGHTKKFMQNKFDEIINFAELEKFVDVPLRNYSSGMKARLAFSISTLVNADILIADEVLSVGDLRFRQKCEDRMQKLTSNGVTILFVSHSMPQVKKTCKKAIWLEKGKIKMMGDSNIVCDSYSLIVSQK